MGKGIGIKAHDLKPEIDALADRLYDTIVALPHDEEAEIVALLALVAVTLTVVRQTADPNRYLVTFITTLHESYKGMEGQDGKSKTR